jgi:hypothetical protein
MSPTGRIRHRPPVPPPAAVPTELRQTAFRGSTALRSGLLTPRQLRGISWRRLLPDVYVHRDVPVTHELRAEAATIRLPEAVVTGCSAAVLWGVELAGPDDDVEVTVPPSHGPVRVPGLRVRRARVAAQDRWHRCGLPVTTAAATAVRVAALLPRDDAVVAVDQLLATGVIDLQRLRAYASAARGPGSARARAVAALADGLAESPQETRLRLLIGNSPLPAPVAQYRVLVNGRFLARVDFAWPELKVAVEYDGLWHAEPGQFARDRRRLNLLREAGWRVVFVTAADMYQLDQLLARIATALSS